MAQPSLEDRFAAHRARLAAISFPDAVKVGDRAPEFDLENARGRRVGLAGLLARGPLVLTFYRGAWCPYCNAQLRGLQVVLPEIEALGASLVAVSPQLPDKSLDLVTMNQLTFEVLSDVGGYVASDYGIVFALTPEDRTLMLEVGNDLVAYNGDDGLLLPAPSTFLIDPVGIVRFAHVGADFTERLDASEVVAGLRRLARS